MLKHTYRIPPPNAHLPLSILLGAAFAVGLFVIMALAQMMGDIDRGENEIDETVMAFAAPEIEEEEIVEEEAEPPPLLEEEALPEMEEEPLQISLDQLDIALNPGGEGDASLAGDFAVPTGGTLLSRSQQDMQDFVDFAKLDQRPRPVGVFGFNFPHRLLKKKVSGRIVLLLKLSDKGEVLDAQIDFSNLPNFNDFVLGEVKDWKFTPPTLEGRRVQARARLPIPIIIN
jgi:hypothetical protein